jgi:hypothetical protein
MLGYPIRCEFFYKLKLDFPIRRRLTRAGADGTLRRPMLCQAVSVATTSAAVPAPAVCGLGIELILILPF